MPSAPIYTLRVPEVFSTLETSLQGLSPEEVESRRALYGLNVLAEPEHPSAWRRWMEFLVHPMAILLWIAGLIILVSGRLHAALVIWVVVLVNASFSFWREYRAEKAMISLRHMLPAYARVKRAGVEVQIPASEIVPGDVLILAEGDNIPADARVVEEYGLRTNNSVLTGEALPARKVVDASIREGLSEVERPNLVFAGTSVVSGTAQAVVYATGMLTQFGRIANLTHTVEVPSSQFKQNIAPFIRKITFIGMGLGVIIFFVGISEVGMPLDEAFLLAIGVVVAVLPEGLVPTITLTLAMATQRLAQKGVLVKNLSVIEDLGGVSLVCTDKSGTLTQNQMAVQELWLAGGQMRVSGAGYAPVGKISSLNGHPVPAGDLQALLQAAHLCNNSRLVPPSAGIPRWTCLGDQTEAALRVLAEKGGVKEEELGKLYPRIHELPFDARRKRMSTIHKNQAAEIAFVKGAPREILQLCTHILCNGQVIPLENGTREVILSANDRYARRALRVLAMARRELPPRQGIYSADDVESGLTFLGLAAMMDPPRTEVAQAMQIFHSAGIRSVMITGDYGLTAESLARRIGMLNSQSAIILTGAELDELDDESLKSLLEKDVVYARMAPEHKLRLVNAYQQRGDVVAVVGDGVNDAPALRKADVGIAMGITGTDVAKEAADVVLTNDNFGAVVDAIKEGRASYDNLRKFTTYILSSNVPEVMPFVLTALFKIPLALSVMQILAIDLGTDIFPALALGIEQPEPDVMQIPPRRRNQPLIDGRLLRRSIGWLGMIELALCNAAFVLVYYMFGAQSFLHLPAISIIPVVTGLTGLNAGVHIYARTAFHAGVVTAQIGNAFACRTEKGRVHRLGWLSNRYLLAGITLEIFIIFLLVYFEPVARLVGNIALPGYFWVGLVLFGPIVYGLERTRKQFTRRFVENNAGAKI